MRTLTADQAVALVEYAITMDDTNDDPVAVGGAIVGFVTGCLSQSDSSFLIVDKDTLPSYVQGYIMGTKAGLMHRIEEEGEDGDE